MPTKANETQTLLTPRQVAQRLGQSIWTVYRKIGRGEIPAIRLGPGNAALRVYESELNRWEKA